ncbi:MAG: carboxypeptidase regulatory-like domain-containing protein, partial [Acidobacteriaceae bacterium]|nr:carboxypeptidase regulatory-like domain-containing protein [Acidobacteriaceae bacterium]
MSIFFKQISVFVIVCAVILCTPRGAFAQGYGSISGTVTDSTGAVVPGAAVTATQTGTGLTVKTTSSGEGTFVFPSMAPSVYNLSASHAGFQTYAVKDLQLRADAALTTNIVLKAGSTTETVTVNAETAQVDVTTGTLSQVIGTSQVNELPLNGRNAAQLTQEVAGITLAPPAQADQGNTKTFPMVVAISANGTFVGQTNYMLDGGNNVDEYTNVNMPFPMPDAVQEFSIQTNNYNAQYGQNAGGVVNIITKSGTTQYHGDLFEYVRNRALNAANYFTYSAATNKKTVDPLKRNQFGGTVGGPLEIPRLLHSNKTFGFFGYQRTINHGASAFSSTILPTITQAGANSSG